MSELKEMYAEMGIEKEVYEYGEAVLEKLESRFRKIDENAEYNQLKVLAAMRENRLAV